MLVYLDTYPSKENRQKFQDISFKKQVKSNPKILEYLNIFFISTRKVNSSIPTLIMSQEFINNTIKHFPKNIYRYATNTNQMMHMKLSFEYLLSNPKINWILDVDDDSFVHFPNVLKLLKHLEVYDSKKPYIFGECASNRPLFTYYHGGGAGHIYSRGLVEDLYPNFNNWIEEMHVQDDVHLLTLNQRYNLSWFQIHIGGMISGIDHQFYRNLKTYHYSNFPLCSVNFSLTRCQTAFHRVNNVFTYHHFWDFFQFNTTWGEIVDQFSDNIYYHDCSMRCKVCKMREGDILKYPNLFSVF